MSDTDRILQILEAMQSDLSHVKTDVSGLKADMTVVKDILSHTNTAIKVLPTKQDLEVTVEAAKSELKADLIRKVQRHERRIENLEDEAGIENPEKN
jgi:hypothetical protein